MQSALDGYDPNASWRPASSAAAMRSQLHRDRYAKVNSQREEEDSRTGPAAVPPGQAMSLGRFLRSPIGLALIAFFIVFIALIAINPPLTQQRSQLAFETPRPNLKSVAIYSAVVAGLVFLSPYVARHFATKEQHIDIKSSSRRSLHRSAVRPHRPMPRPSRPSYGTQMQGYGARPMPMPMPGHHGSGQMQMPGHGARPMPMQGYGARPMPMQGYGPTRPMPMQGQTPAMY